MVNEMYGSFDTELKDLQFESKKCMIWLTGFKMAAKTSFMKREKFKFGIIALKCIKVLKYTNFGHK